MALNSINVTTTQANLLVSSNSTVITTIYITNYSSDANASFNMWAVSSLDSISSKNLIYSNVIVSSNSTYLISSEKIVLENDDRIILESNANAVLAATISYTSV